MTVIGNEMVGQFIDKLVALTTNGRVSWMTLPYFLEENDNEPLRHMVVEDNQYSHGFFPTYLINEYRSYCSTINGGTVIIFNREKGLDRKLTLYIQTTPTGPVSELPMIDYTNRAKLDKLMLEILAVTDDGSKFISEILNM